MSEDPTKIPLPAIVFISLLGGCILILCILYQLLKRNKCCQVKGREGGEEEELEQLIPIGEGGNLDREQSQNDGSKNRGGSTDQSDGPVALGAVITSSTTLTSAAVGITAEVTEQTLDGGEPVAASSTEGELLGNTTVDLSISDASFPSVNLLPIEEEPVSNCGKILLETTFSPVANKMIISVVRAADVPGIERGGTAMVEVHLAILPNKKWKFRTTARPSNSPVFNERYTLFPVSLEMLEEMSIRVRLYGRKRLGKKVLGELEVPMTDIDLHSDLSDEPMWKTLLPYGMVEPMARPKSSSSKAEGIAKIDPPELQISLHYRSLTGRLEVAVLKARSLGSMLTSAKQACYVHIMFLGPDNSSSQSVTKRRTGIEPEFNETFIFTMGLDEIPQVSLMFSLKTGNTVVGWFSLGRNFSGAREERQWSVLCETSDVPLRQWQRLCSAS